MNTLYFADATATMEVNKISVVLKIGHGSSDTLSTQRNFKK